ncbi:MAG: hypothetical protein ACKO9A_14655, partial [Alphaproteobacteria bacterium]
WKEFEAEIIMLRRTLPALRSSQQIAQATEMAACRLKKKKFPKTTHDHNIRHENSLVAFSKVDLCIVPERAVVNDSWVRKYFFSNRSMKSNKKIADAFEKEFKNRQHQIKRALYVYLRNRSKIPCRAHRQNCWLYTYDIPLTVTAFEAGLRRL